MFTKRAGLPEHLAEIWDELMGEVYPTIGTAGLESLCSQVHRAREAGERISTEGMVVQDAKGNPTPHPAIAIEKQAQAEIRLWVTKFGKSS